ncbi:stalk domain-containing protein [Dysosmobacter sp. Phy]
MKKVRRLLSCAAAVCLLGSAAQALEPALDPLPDLSAYPTRLLVDGRAVEEGALPRYLEGGVLLPLRNILEQAGYAVDWDARARGAVFSAEGSGEYLLDPATGDLTLKGARLWTDPAAVVLDGVTYVSAELFDYVEGVAADWDGATNTAVVVTDEPRDNVYCYDLGEGVLTQGKREIPYRMQGVIGVPEGEDRPVVILLHGAHPIRSAAENRYDLGFSYLVDQLADAGYLALSMNVGINYSFENGEPMGCERTVQVVEQQSDLLRRAIEGETGIFPCDLKNKGDLDRVILVGHSWAGYDIFEVAARAEGLGVQGLVSAAPALVSPLSCELADVPVGIIIPQYDGDVTSLDGGTLFDQLEHTPQRSSGTDLIYLKNGNHGGFSTALVRPDPFADRETLPLVMEPERQQAFFGAYVLDFLESVLETGKTPLEAKPTLEGMYGDFPVMLRVDAGGTVLYQASGDSVKALETSGVAAEAENACSTLDHTAEAFRIPGSFLRYDLTRLSRDSAAASVRIPVSADLRQAVYL